MEEICVAVPTDDFLYVKLGHFGDARYYAHYVYKNKRWILKRIVENPYAGTHAHGEEEDEEEGKRPQIYEMNKDCECIVAVAFGPGGEEFMKKRGLKVVRVRPRTTLLDALNAALSVVRR